MVLLTTMLLAEDFNKLLAEDFNKLDLNKKIVLISLVVLLV